MNIIEQGLILNPNTTKLVHCKSCDATWADRKIPKVCPHCGAGKSRLAGAKEEECESFMEAYNEMLASMPKEEESANEDTEDFPDEQVNQTPSQSDRSMETFEYEPIGYDPEEFANSMIENCKVTNFVKRELLSKAESRVKETKWVLQRAGLPTDGLQGVMQDIKSRADKLGKNIPGYTDLRLKMIVDTTLQKELAFPRKGRRYTLSDVDEILRELDIREDYWESYYNIAGIRVA